MSYRRRLATLVAFLFTAVGMHTAACAADGQEVDFQRDIRPILSDNCFQCHGPDEKTRYAGLRLDQRQNALAVLKSGHIAIVPGDAEKSELIRRITSADADVQMPPPQVNKRITPAQVELLRRWINAGAKYDKHWAFVPPIKPNPPTPKHADWARNPIDRFIAARFESQGMDPSPEADKATLIRRATLDLTGLPPTLEEVDAFINDNDPGAYEKVVDRLLSSKRYGEHQARYWLDAVRYGDTHGLHLDNYREMWKYRDWIIKAYNENKPFDQFTVEQIAGDLLPDPTMDQKIATGYVRAHVTTSEGGSIDDEVLVRYAVDRVETTSTIWLGLTTGCAACHDHKYDPISQKEFYQLYAFFNNTAEAAMDGNNAAPPPVVRVPTEDQKAQLDELSERMQAVRARMQGPMPELDAGQAAWEEQWRTRLTDQWVTLDPSEFTSEGGASLTKQPDLSVLAEGVNPARDVYHVTARTDAREIVAIRLDALTDPSLPHTGPGRSENANFVLTEFEATVAPVSDPSNVKTVRFVAAQADHEQRDQGYTIDKAIDGNFGEENGWAIEGFNRREDRTAVFIPAEPIGFEGGTELKVKMTFASRWNAHAIGRFRLSISTDPALAPSTLGVWQAMGPFTADSGAAAFSTNFGPEPTPDLAVSYQDGQMKWTPRPEFTDGKVHGLTGENAATYLYRTIHSPAARDLAVSFGSDDAIAVWLNGRQIHANNTQRSAAPDQEKITLPVRAGENHLLVKIVNYSGSYEFYFNRTGGDVGGLPLAIIDTLKLDPSERTDEQRNRIRDYYRDTHSDAYRQMTQELAKLETKRREIEGQTPTTLIAQEMMDKPRPAFVLVRGEYDKPAEQVQRGTPAALPAFPEDQPVNRLGLARWLLDEDHPLTARVTVNRFWQHVFGTGLVKTAEDLGSQGEFPSHPQLLDWLAREFIDSGWDVKHMMRLMVTSATYRQSSRVSPDLLAKDPRNRFYARGPRFRLDAEVIRDQALFVGDLMVPRIGGPSVRPYQPPGLWEAVGYTSSNTARFTQDQGDALYRRSMYTFWKRTSPPPSMATFDAPSREVCTVRRERTNTPLQALVLLNDVQFVEAARHFAARIMTRGGDTPREKIAFALRIVTARQPREPELSELEAYFHESLEGYQKDTDAAMKLIAVGDSPRNEALDPVELAAWTMVANILLNLDEVVTKG